MSSADQHTDRTQCQTKQRPSLATTDRYMESMGRNQITHITVLKYLAAVIIVIAMGLHTLGITPINSLLQLAGAGIWCYVAVKTNEKAILLNFAPQFAIIIPALLWMYT